MPEPAREQVNRVFANMGKAIAAYESRIHSGPSRFDRYVEATLGRDGRAQEVLSAQEARGLRLFLTKGQCATCHNGVDHNEFENYLLSKHGTIYQTSGIVWNFEVPLKDAIAKGRVKVDGDIVREGGDVAVIKAAIDPVWKVASQCPLPGFWPRASRISSESPSAK